MPDDKPIEIATDHRCLLGDATDALARHAERGDRGDVLASHAHAWLSSLDRGAFERCCLKEYLALAPERFEREIQLPIASDETAKLDTRVLLWPIGSQDGEHPHCEGWAAVMAVQGTLGASEQRDGERQPERPLPLCVPELIHPRDGVSHHIHNRGKDIGVTIHIFGT